MSILDWYKHNHNHSVWMCESDFSYRSKIELRMIEQSLNIVDPKSIKDDLGTLDVLDVTGMERDFIYRPILMEVLGRKSDLQMEESLIALLKRVTWMTDETPRKVGWLLHYQRLVEAMILVGIHKKKN